MNNLVPEKRLDSLGKMVIRWVKRDSAPSKKNSILGTVIPTIPATTDNYIRGSTKIDEARRAELIRKLRERIKNDFNNQPEMARKTGQARNELVFRMLERLDKATRKMEELDPSTLQSMLDSPCKKYSLMRFVTLPGDVSELQFRERMHYMVVDEDRNGAMYNPDLFDKVRDALDVDDLSSYPHESTEHEVVASALSLLHQDWRRRSINGQDTTNAKVDDAYMRNLMTFLMEQPEKAADIKQFLVERDVCLDEVDLTLLDEYINASVPALRDGLL